MKQSMSKPDKKLRVGIIGAGEVAQVIHLPVLALLSHLFTTTIICDISEQVRLAHLLLLLLSNPFKQRKG